MDFRYKNQHRAEAILVTCIDFRFYQAAVDYVKNNLAADFDLLTLPGGQKNFVDHNILSQEAVRIIKEVSLPLHQIKKIILMGHWDCGGYGGSKNFTSIDQEEKKYQDDLKKAKEILNVEFSGLEIIIGYSKVQDDDMEFIII